ncbi:uncharacterized protein LOC136025037 isoform X2 [Artemia franciscana]|uniref:C3H1-type domain-containing protein n=2 Tax=Artemia franciscana TaxID=6661 RepID=A0AA88HXY0_ARTSF|nr:hypothetical protein QYM36_011034 [Artemia franciscana]
MTGAPLPSYPGSSSDMFYWSSGRFVPSSVADWLRAELESHEVDAPVYARCLLSILQWEDNICDSVVSCEDFEEEKFCFWDKFVQLGGPKNSILAFGPTKLNNKFSSKLKDRSHRSRQKKARGRRGTGEGGCLGFCPDEELLNRKPIFKSNNMNDREHMMKSAAIDCLRTACDRKIEAEQLVEELWNKLKESESIIEKADSLESSPDRNSLLALPPSNEGYCQAFPPLGASYEAPQSESNVKWPSVTRKKDAKSRVPFIFRSGGLRTERRQAEHFVAPDGYDGDISSRESSKDRRQMKNYYYDLKDIQTPLTTSSKFLPLFQSTTNVAEGATKIEADPTAATGVTKYASLEESFMSLLKLQELDPKLNEIEAKFTAALANIWNNDDKLHIKAEVRAVRFPINASYQADLSIGQNDIINANSDITSAVSTMPPPGFENVSILGGVPQGQSKFKDFFADNNKNTTYLSQNIMGLKVDEQEMNLKNLEEESALRPIEEDFSLKASLSSQSLMEESLAILNHSKEESCFAEVTPTLYKTPSGNLETIPDTNPLALDDAVVDANYQGLLELLNNSAVDEVDCNHEVQKKEENECLLTSTRTHFVPIKEECSESLPERYEDGATFEVASTLDKVSYLRSQSGTLILPGEDYNRYMVYRESNLPANMEKPDSPECTESFPLKFKVKETEKFCQTDLDGPAAFSSRCETPTENMIESLNFARFYDTLYVPEVENTDYIMHRVWTSESLNDPWLQDEIVNKEVEIEIENGNTNTLNEDQDGENLLAEIWTALSGESDIDEDQGIGHSEENFDCSYDVFNEGANNVWESAALPEGYETWSYGENVGEDFYEQAWLQDYGEGYGQEAIENEDWPPVHIPVEYLDDELFDEIFGNIVNNPCTAESEGGSKKSSSQSKKKKKSGEKWKNKRRRHGSYHRPCMYFVEGECRRADCQFSHDLGAIPCRFWLEGGCFKAESCPFRHGACSEPGNTEAVGMEKGFELESESDFPTLGGKEAKEHKVSEPRPIPKQKIAGSGELQTENKKQKQRSRRFTTAAIIGSAASTSETTTPHASQRRRKNKKKTVDDSQTLVTRRRKLSEHKGQ